MEDKKLDKLIHDLLNQSLLFDEGQLTESIDGLEKILRYSHLSGDHKRQIQLNLTGAYQRRGLHTKALDMLSALEEDKIDQASHLHVYITQLKAKSLSALEEFKLATSALDSVIGIMLAAKDNKEGMGFFLVEAGKIYLNGGQGVKARQCLEKSVALLEGDKNEIEHYERAKSNLAILMLYDEEADIAEKGVALLRASMYVKSEIGDLEGLATNYCNLGLYYWRKEDYKGAIAHLRKDLWITRKIGDLHGIAISLRNLTSLYLVLKQLKQAKRLAIESIQIGNEIGDKAIVAKAKSQLAQVVAFGKQAGIAQEPVGDKAYCLCKSGTRYEDCCGEADHEPIDFPFRFAGVAEELGDISKKYKNPSRLDFIFRESHTSKKRLSWQRVEIQNGWYKLFELPDMANTYLFSAKELLAVAKVDPEGIHNPLSCLILSVSALEAYINQVAYFLDDIKSYPESNLHAFPQEFDEGVLNFQRTVELTLKWSILGSCVCGEMWSPSQKMWDNFKTLIAVRNEFIHFKLAEYEQVIPVPKTSHPILRKLPKEVETREVFHAWPIRILTPSLAAWAVRTAEDMIQYFKEQYERKRLEGSMTSEE